MTTALTLVMFSLTIIVMVYAMSREDGETLAVDGDEKERAPSGRG